MSIKTLSKALLSSIITKYLGQEFTRELDRQTVNSSDLIFSSLGDNKAITPLSGYTPQNMNNPESIIFPEGFNVTFRIFHNDLGDATILLHHMELTVCEYWHETDLDTVYKREGKRIIGAGPSIQDFEIEFSGNTVFPAERVLGPSQYVKSKDENFFNIEPSNPIEFKKNGSSAQIKVCALAKKQGFYVLNFIFIYNIAAKQKKYLSPKILVIKK